MTEQSAPGCFRRAIGRCFFSSFLLLLLAWNSAAQFVAYNDHAPGMIGVTTHSNATTWNIFGNPPGAGGSLKDITTGADLPVLVTITPSGAVNPAPNAANPNPGTPLYSVFNGYVDFQGAGNSDAVAQVTGSSTVTYTFTGLDPTRTYSFKGSAVRGGSGGTYPYRWSLFELSGALSFSAAHTPGCYTNGLAANQVAINTGINTPTVRLAWSLRSTPGSSPAGGPRMGPTVMP
jgi:hypothetical protein